LKDYEIVDLAQNLEINNAKLNPVKYEVLKFNLKGKRKVYLILHKNI